MSQSQDPIDAEALAESFNELNTLDEFHSVSELEVGKQYLILGMDHLPTKHGVKLRCMVERPEGNWTVILPTRFSAFAEFGLLPRLWAQGKWPCITFNGTTKTKAHDLSMSIRTDVKK